MFDKICIKSREFSEGHLDMSFLIDTMLFYGEVNVLAHTAEIAKLLETFGEETLHHLILSGRMKLHIRQNILGIGHQPSGDKIHYGVELFHAKDISVHNTLYTAHQQLVHNSTRNMQFADHFAEIVTGHVYDPIVFQMIEADFQNPSYLTDSVTEILRTYIPEYSQPDPVRVEIEKDDRPVGPFSSSYVVHSNIDFGKINSIHAKYGKPNVSGHSSFLLTLVEARGDNYISGQFESEFATGDLNSTLMNMQLADVIQRTRKSEGEIIEFNKHVLADCPSIGTAFVSGQITGKQLLKLLEEGDKFRKWLGTIDPNADLVNRYISEALAPALSDKAIIKTARVAATGLAGLIPGLGTVASVADTFFVDKLINGWKPNHFIDGKLKPTLSPKS